MQTFASAWPNPAITQQVVAQIPWGLNLALLAKLHDVETRLWYAQECVKQGWSRSILELHIERRLHERQGKALNNFQGALPPGDSDMAAQIFKDPYLFDMLGTADPRREAEVERALGIRSCAFGWPARLTSLET